MSSVLSSVFLWFYCLPLWKAAAIVLTCSGGFLLLDRRLRERRGWRPMMLAMLAVWLTGVLWTTLLGRETGDGQGMILAPLHSWYTVLSGGEIELIRANMMNVLLFFPGGVVMERLLSAGWSGKRRLLTVAAALAAVSLAIELCQGMGQLGRAETDDVLHNALGGWLGGLFGWRCFRPRSSHNP